MEPVVITVSLLTLAAVGMLVFVVIRERNKPPQSDQSLVMLQQQMNGLQERLDKFGQTVAENLQQSSAAMNTRLDNAAKVVGDLREKVGQIHEVGKAAAELVNILRAPKLRGGMGELFLGDLLAQILPPEHFKLQHRFKSGEAVDAVIQIGQKFVPVDAKFPYENFKRIVEAQGDVERVAARKQFLKDVKKHVDAIATKYILPDEGTYDFALMYVPAENVYYETIIREETGEDRQLFGYALERRVIPVSPNSFYAYLQTILLGLRGMKVEERAQEILATLARLRGDFEKLEENFRLLGRHLTNASGAYTDTEKTLTKLDAKLSQAEQPQLPPALSS
ncbi:MAG TPA: DNA recombination protein RmuC [Verrucomicrobiae bacterium]|nr:DNA recombination protein RmuC [Verrucomicrobiae bacterium]